MDCFSGSRSRRGNGLPLRGSLVMEPTTRKPNPSWLRLPSTGSFGATVILSVPAFAEAKLACLTICVPTFSTVMPAML